MLGEQVKASSALLWVVRNPSQLQASKNSVLQLPSEGANTCVQVKWLRTIEVLDTHSTNHYHRHDNKVCEVSCLQPMLGSARC